jgi:hypothetical protein
MSEPTGETTGPGLGTHPLVPGHHLPSPPTPPRRTDWSQTGGNGWGYRGSVRSARRDRRSKSDRQMNYGGRLRREAHLIYEELLKTPPIVLLILSCLAVLLVGAIVVGATR